MQTDIERERETDLTAQGEHQHRRGVFPQQVTTVGNLPAVEQAQQQRRQRPPRFGHQDRIHALNQHVTDNVIPPPEQGGQRQ